MTSTTTIQMDNSRHLTTIGSWDVARNLLADMGTEAARATVADMGRRAVADGHSVAAQNWRMVWHGINRLSARPAEPKQVDVPEGRYAVENADGELRFYKVDRPTEGRWRGYTFVNVQASDDLHPIRNRAERERILAAIGADVQGAMLRYGREIGKCGHCGRTLTNEESREYGIGPICREGLGW